MPIDNNTDETVVVYPQDPTTERSPRCHSSGRDPEMPPGSSVGDSREDARTSRTPLALPPLFETKP